MPRRDQLIRAALPLWARVRELCGAGFPPGVSGSRLVGSEMPGFACRALRVMWTDARRRGRPGNSPTAESVDRAVTMFAMPTMTARLVVPLGVCTLDAFVEHAS
ncbi:hypothetical protein SALBM135S_09633 [Streptomyces alboniger]